MDKLATFTFDLEDKKIFLDNKNKCDNYDYLISVACGAIGGIIDIFAVGSPENSFLGKWTDEMIDNLVKKFATLSGWNPRDEKRESLASAISFLENKYRINYDQRYNSDVKNLFNMSTRNHHMLSLSHSPDVVGLFFSILNQFTSTSTFLSNGSLITISTDDFELRGNNTISKIFSGISNWFGHLMSDIAGSSGTKANGGRGSGIVAPFYELFSLFKFGKFDIGKDKQDLAILATRAFQSGYDARFAITQSIPVIITELLIRLIWGLRRYFQYGKTLRGCIPSKKHNDLRMMLIFGNATLCIIDGSDAIIKSKGNALTFFMYFNLMAWCRFTILVIKEAVIQLHIDPDLENTILGYMMINEYLKSYLNEIEKINIDLFKYESSQYYSLVNKMNSINSEVELNKYLSDVFQNMNWNKPWEGEFEEHMLDKNAKFIFE